MDTSALLQLIRTSFDDDELRELCFRLRVEYEDLGGAGRSAKARELVAFCERHARLAELEQTARQLAQELGAKHSARHTQRPGYPAGQRVLINRKIRPNASPLPIIAHCPLFIV